MPVVQLELVHQAERSVRVVQAVPRLPESLQADWAEQRVGPGYVHACSEACRERVRVLVAAPPLRAAPEAGRDGSPLQVDQGGRLVPVDPDV